MSSLHMFNFKYGSSSLVCVKNDEKGKMFILHHRKVCPQALMNTLVQEKFTEYRKKFHLFPQNFKHSTIHIRKTEEP